MKCMFSDLRYKEVINVATGQRMGYLCDVEIDLESGCVTAFILPGCRRMGGLLPGEPDWALPWSGIVRIGEDIILANLQPACRREPRGRKLPFPD